MATEEVLHMNDGVGETSYANNSLLQRKVSLKVKPILKEHITKVYTNIDVSDCLKVADLGCSSGPNTLLIASEIMGMIDEISLRLKKKKTPAFQIFLNDLPSNDFNTIFNSLPDFYKNLQHEKGHNFGPNCFILGAPGSFYGRLFPENSIHFFHSSYSLHWLSQVPKGLSGRNLNEGNIYIANTSCEAVWKAYFEQFEDDFKVFLKHRSVELVKGGGMVLTFIGRPQDQQPLTIHSLIGITLHDMVLEVPKGLSSNGGEALNKDDIYISNKSPGGVWKAYVEQFEQDFLHFLRHRSVELVNGGSMLLTLLGRLENQDPTTTFNIIGMALHDLILQNKIEEAKLECFDIPYYGPTEKEVRKIIEREGSFRVERIEIIKLGTGKSSLVAAMANYLNFDVYDLELTDLMRNSELRKLLISTGNRSILVVEDIDCSIELQNLDFENAKNTIISTSTSRVWIICSYQCLLKIVG
ncbi:salicylate carboxymethyltransferase-like [Senna tora]|uniref:Salicylate carboxymethyltransferase-like n=1 Tax=Senna tora TaxID=362788 RepID=A0A834SVN8_9FABA|nr:salicylate carboxymethyltransferase-like [Senna tora]